MITHILPTKKLKYGASMSSTRVSSATGERKITLKQLSLSHWEGSPSKFDSSIVVIGDWFPERTSGVIHSETSLWSVMHSYQWPSSNVLYPSFFFHFVNPPNSDRQLHPLSSHFPVHISKIEIMNRYHTNHKLSFFSCDTSHFLPAFAHLAQIGFSSEQRRFALLQPRHPRNDRIFFPSFAVGAIDDDYLGQARAIYTQGWRMTGIRYIIRVAVKMWMWWVDILFWSKMQSLVSTRLCWREHILNLDFTGNLKSEESIRGKNSNTQILNEMISILHIQNNYWWLLQVYNLISLSSFSIKI